jgi:hypothetical protein
MAKLTGSARLILDAKETGVDAMTPDDTVHPRRPRARRQDAQEHDYARGIEIKKRKARKTRISGYPGRSSTSERQTFPPCRVTSARRMARHQNRLCGLGDHRTFQVQISA